MISIAASKPKTFHGRSTAQRAARRALCNPKAVEGRDFVTARCEEAGFNQWTYSMIVHGSSATVLTMKGEAPRAMPLHEAVDTIARECARRIMAGRAARA